MKAERRHELKESSLTHAAGDAWGYMKRHGRAISWAVLIAAVIVAGSMWFIRYRRSAQQLLQQEFDQLMTARPGALPENYFGRLKEMATQDDDERKAALANVRLGDEYRRLLRDGLRGPSGEDPAEAAGQHYRRVLDGYGDYPVAVGGARYGLGRLAEARADRQAAVEQYDAVLAMESLRGTAVRALAEQAKSDLDELDVTVEMVPEKPKPPEPADDAENETEDDSDGESEDESGGEADADEGAGASGPDGPDGEGEDAD